MCCKSMLLCVVGPTACHKTETAVALAKRFHGEIVSADSVQLYFGMDIGSAKPTQEEQQGIPHHLIDCLPVNTPLFSVSEYRELAVQAIADIAARAKLPIIAGGSGLYVNALTTPLNFAVPSNPDIRTSMEAEYLRSPQDAFARLRACDPVTADRLHPNDQKRIVRALEVFYCSGRPLSSFGDDFTNKAEKQAPYDAIMVGLRMEREQLYRRIELRVDRMLEQGLLAEAERIYRAGYSRRLPAMQAIGYQQLFRYFDGVCSLEEAVVCMKRDTRRFAKRQLTWFQRDQRIRWFDATCYNNDLIQSIERFIQERL